MCTSKKRLPASSTRAVRLASPQLSIELIDRWEMLDFGIYFTLAMVALGYT